MNLAYKVCDLDEGIKALASDQALGALCTALRYGSPRVRLVVCRILRRALCPTKAGEGLGAAVGLAAGAAGAASAASDDEATRMRMDQAVARCMGENSSEASGVPGERSVRFLLSQVGEALTVSVMAALTKNKTAMNLHLPLVQELLAAVPLHSVLSTSGIHPWTEIITLVRALVRDAPGWCPSVAAVINDAVGALPKLARTVYQVSVGEEEDHLELAGNRAMFKDIHLALGALGVLGGQVETLGVGSVVRHLADDYLGVVVNRMQQQNKMLIVRAGEEELVDAQCTEFTVEPEVPVRLASFKGVDVVKLVGAMLSIVQVLVDERNHRFELKEAGEDAPVHLNVAALVSAQLYSSSLRVLHATLYSPSVVAHAISRSEDALKLLFRAAVHRGTVSETTCKLEDGLIVVSSALARSVANIKETVLAIVQRSNGTIIIKNSKDKNKINSELCSLGVSKLALQASSSSTAAEKAKGGDKKKEKAAANAAADDDDDGEGATDSKEDPAEQDSKTDSGAPTATAGAAVKRSAKGKSGGSGSDKPARATISARLSYIPLNEDVTPMNCKGKIVVLDTYGEYDARIASAAMNGAQAIVLAVSYYGEAERLGAKTMPTVAPKKVTTAASFTPGSGGKGGKKNEKEKKLPRFQLKVDIPVLLVRSNEGDQLRVVANVPRAEYPTVVWPAMQSKMLQDQGFPAHLVDRAMKKCSNNVDAALAWLQENAEWLQDQSMVMAELDLAVATDKAQEAQRASEAAQKKQAEATKKKQMKAALKGMAGKGSKMEKAPVPTAHAMVHDEKEWPLGLMWHSGVTTSSATSVTSTVQRYDITQFANLASNQRSKDSWYSTNCDGHGVSALCGYAMRFMNNLTVHYARRCLTAAFCHWPRDVRITSVVSGEALQQMLHVGLSTGPFEAADAVPDDVQVGDAPLRELPPLQRDSQFREQVLHAIRTEEASDAPVGDAILSDCFATLKEQVSLGRAQHDKTYVHDPLMKAVPEGLEPATVVKPILAAGGDETKKLTGRIHVRYAKLMRLELSKVVASFPRLFCLRVYKNKKCTDRLAVVTRTSTADVVYSGDTVYYQIALEKSGKVETLAGIRKAGSSDFMETFKFNVYVSIDKHLLPGQVMPGTLQTVLSLTELMLEAETNAAAAAASSSSDGHSAIASARLPSLLLALFKALAFVPNAMRAKSARLVARLFRRWAASVVAAGPSAALPTPDTGEVAHLGEDAQVELVELFYKLQRAHSWLRTASLARSWTAASSFAAPMQALMELLLASKQSLAAVGLINPDGTAARRIRNLAGVEERLSKVALTMSSATGAAGAGAGAGASAPKPLLRDVSAESGAGEGKAADAEEDSSSSAPEEVGVGSEAAAMQGREGPSVCSLIVPSSSQHIGADMKVIGTRNNGVNHFADVCLRRGKWFFEVILEVSDAPTMPANSGYVNASQKCFQLEVGFAGARYPAGNQLGQHGSSPCFVLHGTESTYYRSKGMNVPVVGVAANSGGPVAPPQQMYGQQASFGAGAGAGAGAFGGGGFSGSGGRRGGNVFGNANGRGNTGGWGASQPPAGGQPGEGKERDGDAADGDDDDEGRGAAMHAMLLKKKKEAEANKREPFAWQTGAVVGCMVDMDTQELQWFLNGEPQPPQFKGFRAPDGVFPAFCVRNSQYQHAIMYVRLCVVLFCYFGC